MSSPLAAELLRELRYGLPEDEADSIRLADDCLRLAEVSDEDFPLVARTHWYRSLWASLGQQKLAEAADACQHAAQARDLLFELVRLLVLHSPEGGRLLAQLGEALAFHARRRGRLVGELGRLAERVQTLQEHLSWRGAAEADERQLPESLKLLLLRAMIGAAWAGGEVGEPEVRLLTRKIQSLALSPAAAQRVRREITHPQPLDQDLRDIEDPDLALLIYRNLAAVTVADGRIELKENLLLARCAEALGIPAADAAQIERELFSLASKGGLDALVRALGAEPEAPSPPVRRLLGELAPVWSRVVLQVSEHAAWDVVRPLLTRVDAALRSPDVDRATGLLDPDATGLDLRTSVDAATAEWGSWLDRVLGEALPGLAEAPEIRWLATAGPELRANLDEHLRPVVEKLQAVGAAARELRALQEDPLQHLRRRGRLPVLTDPSDPASKLFVVPDAGQLRQSMEASQREWLARWEAAIAEAVHEAERLHGEVARAVIEGGEAYLEHVLRPLLEGLARQGRVPAGFLRTLARQGAALARRR